MAQISIKTKWFLMLSLSVIFSAFNYSEPLNFHTLTIQILATKDNYNAGEIVFFTININSNEYIEKFEIEPSIKGANDDAIKKFNFDIDTKQATINYFYAIPKDIKKNKTIIFTFNITDKATTETIEKQIRIKN